MKFNVELHDNGEDGQNVYEVLGINEERSDEIAELVKEAYNDETLFTDTLKRVVESLEEINEVIFAILLCARMHSRKESHGMDEAAKKLEILATLMKLRAKL